MKVVVFYRPKSEQSSVVEEFIRNFRSTKPDVDIEAIDIDGPEGTHAAELYDIVRYPAIAVVQSDGSLSNLWQGEQLPRVDDVMSYLMA